MDDQVELASKGRVHSIAERNEISSRDRTRFERLLREWNEQCKLRSPITEIVALPSHQNIIGMGDAAVPLILEQLGQEDEPRHWFWALRSHHGSKPGRYRRPGRHAEDGSGLGELGPKGRVCWAIGHCMNFRS